jgi:hypothetical protein
MALHKLAWFPFYSGDWLSDENVRRMTFEEKGIYVELLCIQWLEGGLPVDCNEIAKLLGPPYWMPRKNKSSPQFNKCWSILSKRFVKRSICFKGNKFATKLVQKRLFFTRKEQQRIHIERKKAGKKGGEKSGIIRRQKSLEANASIEANASFQSKQTRTKSELELDKKYKSNNITIEGGNIVYEHAELMMEILREWNIFAENHDLPRILKLTKNRQKKLNARLKDEIFRKNWKKALAIIAKSDWHLGDNERNWRANFDWFIRSEDQFMRLLEREGTNKRKKFYPEKELSFEEKVQRGLIK